MLLGRSVAQDRDFGRGQPLSLPLEQPLLQLGQPGFRIDLLAPGTRSSPGTELFSMEVLAVAAAV